MPIYTDILQLFKERKTFFKERLYSLGLFLMKANELIK